MIYVFRILLLALAGATLTSFSAETAAPQIRLAVAISVDQLRADYLVRFRPYFGEGGFKRLLEGGMDFQNCHYRHALTQTAPGHATVMSGVFPSIHGITGNSFMDRETWETINNVEDRNAPLVGFGPGEATAALLAPEAGRSPRNFQADTIGDQLKLRHGNRSKVFGASNKDRSAILLGGRLADAAYWDENGRFVTSTYYRNQLPAWVAAFNAEGRVAAAHGKTWDRLRDAAIYDAVQGPDDAPGEYDGAGLGRTFPRKITGGTTGVSAAFLNAFDNSPFNTEVLGAFIERAVREERLGRHEATDFLGVGFSQLDIVGHSYGPDSHEVMDSMLRLDQVLASLFACLDREVGAGRWVAVLTADHGVAPLPERVQSGRPEIPAGRVSFGAMDAAARQALDAAFGPLPAPEYWFKRDNFGYHLRPSAMAAKKVSPEAVAQVLKASVLKTSWVAAAWTRAELLAEEPAGDSLLASVRRGYYAPRDCDVIFVLQPYFMSKAPTGTTHGSPYVYDTHVPQLWYGAGVPQGARVERVGVEDIAPTMAGLLGLTAPPQTQGRRLF